MADNATVGNGAAVPADLLIATDEIGGAKVQRVKLFWGVDGAGVDASATDPLPVVIAVLPALAAGTNAIGKLAANSGVDIGDTDVTSVVPGVAATSLGKAEDAVHASGDVGVMALAVRSDTAAALAGTTGDYTPLIVDSLGRLHVSTMGSPATTATITRTASSASNVANLVALNTSRTGLTIVNESTATLYLKYGTTASLTDYTQVIYPAERWEMPATPRWTGRIDGIWSAANGFAQITELAP